MDSRQINEYVWVMEALEVQVEVQVEVRWVVIMAITIIWAKDKCTLLDPQWPISTSKGTIEVSLHGLIMLMRLFLGGRLGLSNWVNFNNFFMINLNPFKNWILIRIRREIKVFHFCFFYISLHSKNFPYMTKLHNKTIMNSFSKKPTLIYRWKDEKSGNKMETKSLASQVTMLHFKNSYFGQWCVWRVLRCWIRVRPLWPDPDPHHLKFVDGIEFGLIGKLEVRRHFERIGRSLPNVNNPYQPPPKPFQL